MTLEDIRALIRTVPDFPKTGIQFRDISTLLAHGPGLAATIDHLCERAEALGPSAIAGIEARGFLFGAAMAARLGLGFILLRKPGKLPVPTIGHDYALEYGTARLELDPTLVDDGRDVLIVDDLLATGGTALAGAHLLRQAGARVDHAMFVVDLPDLGGARALEGADIRPQSLVAFDGD
ncbi:adenine phosphoribosyltransferase [Paraurantiacibacter namhicola]|uniref:Adenine phosphoribosyltransferase n=1 Tax=Paraurantiacibacter namhicola TaxID=645517 RepID=A0A1C7D5S3_9SPHN|nr:adenine phosphoribosyltransferase [Paraurantiacibacter namhicola]ANU06653.1 Adenine phosphoribosyltransferase [Paraurantiacibacter namhicola]